VFYALRLKQMLRAAGAPGCNVTLPPRLRVKLLRLSGFSRGSRFKFPVLVLVGAPSRSRAPFLDPAFHVFQRDPFRFGEEAPNNKYLRDHH
jgi:hypothetical protein